MFVLLVFIGYLCVYYGGYSGIYLIFYIDEMMNDINIFKCFFERLNYG